MDYIGWTSKSIKQRVSEHIAADSYIGNAIRKHEMNNFKIEWLWQSMSRETILYLEKAAIVFYKTRAPNGYNLTPGGDGGDTCSGRHPTEESKEKNRQAHLGIHPSEETIEKLRQVALGNKRAEGKRSEETIEKNRKSHLKEKLSKETIEKMKKAALGNKNAEGYKHIEEAIEKMRGNKNGLKHGRCTKEAKIEKLKTRVKKLDIELAELCDWDGT